jgi:hypothetical protein
MTDSPDSPVRGHRRTGVQLHRGEKEWAKERQLLLNRIQRPEWIHLPSNDFEVPEPEVDEFNLVGSIK